MSERCRCPECGVSVNVENLPTHYGRLHPRVSLDPRLRKRARTAERDRRPRQVSLRSERRLWLTSAVVLLVGLGIAIGVQDLAAPGTGPAGVPAPDFELATSAGGTVRLSEFRGRVVLLDFMSTSCTWCQQFTRDVLVPLYEGHRDRFVLVSIDINHPGDDLAAGNARINTFRSEYGATWFYALDLEGIAAAYGVRGTPTHFIVDRSGGIAYGHEGVETADEVLAQLARVW